MQCCGLARRTQLSLSIWSETKHVDKYTSCALALILREKAARTKKCPTRHLMQPSISTSASVNIADQCFSVLPSTSQCFSSFSSSLHISGSFRGLVTVPEERPVAKQHHIGKRGNMAIRSFALILIAAASVICLQQTQNQASPMFPPYLRYPGLRHSLNLRGKNFQQDAFHLQQVMNNPEVKNHPPYPQKRTQYQRPRTEGFQELNSFPQKTDKGDKEEGGWLAQLGHEEEEDKEGGGNKGVKEEVDKGRECVDKVMMVEETEYDEVLTCDHTHDNR